MKKANKPAGAITPAQKRPAQKKITTKPTGLKNAQRAAGLADRLWRNGCKCGEARSSGRQAGRGDRAAVSHRRGATRTSRDAGPVTKVI
jgi:hypothetical protein